MRNALLLERNQINMRKILLKILLLIFATFLFFSCQQETLYDFTEINTPAEIAERAFNFVELYEQSETVYVLGGQDPARSAIIIDCSGLIIMCYKYALVDTKYQLLENDMTANYMYQNASAIIDKRNAYEQLRFYLVKKL